MRNRIVEAYRQVLVQHPGLAPGIVTDLMAWEQWGLADSILPIVSTPPPGMDQASLLQIRAYLRKAGEVTATPHHARDSHNPGHGSLLIALALLISVPVGLSLWRWRAGRRRKVAS